MPNLLKFIALRVGQLLNVAELSRLMGIPAPTLHRYITLLQALYMICFCAPWKSNMGKRLVKSPKVYLVDTGIVSYLQGVTFERMLSEPLFTGHILENFVWQELTKQVTWSKLQVQLLHFRTESGIEVDIVLEDMMGRVVGIELKNRDTIRAEDFKGLEYLQEELGEKFIRGIVLYTGNQYVGFSKKLAALPFSSLWE